MNARPGLDQLGLSTGKQARSHRILHEHGLRNGTALFLPYDQGLEHGPRDFFANPAASDPKSILGLALEGGFNGIAIQIGLAEKFYWEHAGEAPLVLKLNGKTDIPAAIDPLSPVNASVEDAVRLGADAVGYYSAAMSGSASAVSRCASPRNSGTFWTSTRPAKFRPGPCTGSAQRYAQAEGPPPVTTFASHRLRARVLEACCRVGGTA
jgi:hypothetical protein